MSLSDELIARLESSSEGSRELDVLVIASIVGGEALVSSHDGRWHVYLGTDRRGEPRLWEPRAPEESRLHHGLRDERGPTRSVDTALTLVPEGFNGNLELLGYAYFWQKDAKSGFDCAAATLSLAICAAALKARMVS